MSAQNHILLVNYDFPPNHGIGGRRWGKFARQLAHFGYVVHVLKAEPLPKGADSAWKEDVIHANIRITSLPRQYPSAFSHPGSDLLSKMKYRIHKWNLERIVEGTIYDLSIGWSKVFLPAARKLIRQHNIGQVIATGAPWQMLYDLCSIKPEFPGIQFLIDFRDPWITAMNYGMSGLSASRKSAEANKQTFVLENADVVTTPAQHITDELKFWATQHCKKQAHFELLSHFFDPDDFVRPTPEEHDKYNKITFVYGGDLYMGMEPQLKMLRDQILDIKARRPDLYSNFQVRIFTNSSGKILNGIEAIEVNTPIGKKLIDEIQKSHFCLVMLPDNKRNDMTTKFVEYFAYRKPMLVVASPGSASEFAEHHRIGVRLNDSENHLEKIIERALLGDFPYDPNFDYSSYSLPLVTQKLISLFSPALR
jgi:hypothetical protein